MAEKKCNNCGSKKPSSVPYPVFEILKDNFKKVWIALIISIILNLLIVGAFTYERLQYDYAGETTETITVDGKSGGNANYIGNNGDIINGENNSKEINSQAKN